MDEKFTNRFFSSKKIITAIPSYPGDLINRNATKTPTPNAPKLSRKAEQKDYKLGQHAEAGKSIYEKFPSDPYFFTRRAKFVAAACLAYSENPNTSPTDIHPLITTLYEGTTKPQSTDPAQQTRTIYYPQSPEEAAHKRRAQFIGAAIIGLLQNSTPQPEEIFVFTEYVLRVTDELGLTPPSSYFALNN